MNLYTISNLLEKFNKDATLIRQNRYIKTTHRPLIPTTTHPKPHRQALYYFLLLIMLMLNW